MNPAKNSLGKECNMQPKGAGMLYKTKTEKQQVTEHDGWVTRGAGVYAAT